MGDSHMPSAKLKKPDTKCCKCVIPGMTRHDFKDENKLGLVLTTKGQHEESNP